MTGALLYLLFTSWKNRLFWRIRRMKQPKYLFGVIVGGLYFYFYFGRFVFNPSRNGLTQGLGSMFGNGPDAPLFAELTGALILFLIVLLTWVIPHERAALVFTEAEVAFLFPAPVGRRTLIHFKLLKSQVMILFTTVFMTLIFRRSQGGTAWTHALGWWVIFSTLSLHSIGSSFARTLLLERGISNWKRRTLVLTLVALAAGAIGVWAWRTLPPPPVGEIKALGDIQYYVEQVLQSGPLPYLLYPLRLVVQPYLAPDLGSFLRAFAPALGLIALLYVWVVKSNVAFEEASVDASRKMAEKIAAIRSGKQRPFSGARKAKRAPFNLRPTGLPSLALMWKNLIGAGQAFTTRTWIILFAVLLWIGVIAYVTGSGGHHGHGHAQAAGMSVAIFLGPMAAMLLAMSFLLGPQLVRQDFRQNLPMMDLLKTYPLPAWQIALGELLAPAAILATIQWCLIALCVLILPQMGLGEKFPFGLVLAVAFAVALLAPVLDLVILVIPNAAVLLFPGWFQTGRDAPAGIEATGQRLIFAIGQMLALAVVLLPAGALFAGVILAGQWLGHPLLAIPVAALAATVIVAGEAALGVLLLGKLFERFDVSGEAVPG